MILNPDLTNVDLQPNSSMLIKITLPVEKQTEVVANIKTNIEENGTVIDEEGNENGYVEEGKMKKIASM